MKSFVAALAMVVELTCPRMAGAAETGAAVRTHNLEIAQRSPGASALFSVQDDGRVLHLLSGLRCPASLPNFALWHLEVFKNDGTDIGCDYGRANAQGLMQAKLSIFLVRSENSTLDKAFADYRAEFLKATPNAQYKGTALKVSGADGVSDPLGEFRSAEYLIDMDGRRYISDLLVVVRDGWVIEVRGTFPSDVFVDPKATDPSSIMAGVGDLATPALALLSILDRAGSGQGR